MMLGYVNVKTEKPFADKSILMKALLTRLSKLKFFKKEKKKKLFELYDINSSLKGIMLWTVLGLWDLHQEGFTAYLIPFILLLSERFLKIEPKKTLSYKPKK